MLFISRSVALAIIAFLLAACSTVQIGQNFDVRSVETKIERGVTTQEQIRTWLGAPTNTGGSLDTSGERFDEWTYYYASGKLPDMSGARVKMLQIKFDKRGGRARLQLVSFRPVNPQPAILPGFTMPSGQIISFA